MFFSAVVLIVSAALFLFYLQATCQKVLRREFDQPYFESIVRAYRLEFLSVRKAVQGADATLDHRGIQEALQADFQTLNYLMKSAVKRRCSPGERLLMLYFKTLLFFWAVRRALGLRRCKPAQKLTVVLQYFANVVGQHVDPRQCAALAPSESGTPS
jgi:hypothetical protein